MGLLQRLMHKEPPHETKCSRCGVLAPEGSLGMLGVRLGPA